MADRNQGKVGIVFQHQKNLVSEIQEEPHLISLVRFLLKFSLLVAIPSFATSPPILNPKAER